MSRREYILLAQVGFNFLHQFASQALPSILNGDNDLERFVSWLNEQTKDETEQYPTQVRHLEWCPGPFLL